MPASAFTSAFRKARAVIRASGHVIVNADLPAGDLVALAEVAAQWGASLTLRKAHLYGVEELEKIAAAGRGHVTFDLAE